MTHLIHKYDLQIDDLHSLSRNKINEWCYNRWFSEINKDYFTYAQIIRELIIMKKIGVPDCFLMMTVIL